jgi:hypothetical protein
MPSDFAFSSWMAAVDLEVQRLASVSVHDLADQTYRGWFDDGYPPEDAAREALENEGFPFEEKEND